MSALMEGRVVLVTGATSGIGRETARQLASMGARVLVHGRSLAKAQATVQELGLPGLEPVAADLSLMAEVRALAEQVRERTDRLDVLVNNAGMTTDQHTTTSEGHELCLAVNHLAPFLLTRELLPLLEAAAPARVVTVSSALYASAKRLDLDELASPARYSWQDVYNRTKLANVLFTRALSRRLEGTGVTANCLHPGVIATGFGSDLGGIGGWMFGAMKWFLPGPEAGARTSVHLASSPAVQDTTGGYFEKSTPKPLKGLATDDALAESLWTWTEERLKA